MSNLAEKLKIIVLDCPYDTIGDPVTQKLLGRTTALKILGYRQQYDYGVLPVDTTEFIATHLLVCRESVDGWVPVTGVKFTTLERAKKHGIVFPGLGLAFSGKSVVHQEAVREIMQSCEDSGRQLAYISGWTMDPSVANDRELRQVLRDMFEAIYILHHLDAGIEESLVGGTLRFRTELLFQFWGYESIRQNGCELPSIHIPHLLDEEVVIMHLREFKKEAIEKVQPWRFHWKNRLVISGNEAQSGALIPGRKAA